MRGSARIPKLLQAVVWGTVCSWAMSWGCGTAGLARVHAADGVAGPAGPAIVSLVLEPPLIQFSGLQRQQQLQVSAKTGSGALIDVTHDCKYQLSDSTVATLDGSLLTGAHRGRTELTVTYRGLSVHRRVRVDQMQSFPRIDFESDIAPLFSKLGCNSGGCHGKALGRKGFKLSVFGSEPEVDYRSLVDESRGRRLFPGAPGRSLLVRKAVGEIAHGGGRRTDRGSQDYALLTEWIRQGMTRRAPESGTLTAIRVSPSERILAPESVQQILVTAVYSDGTRRDVTPAASYSSNLQEVANVDRTGRIQVGAISGEAAITVNYMGRVSAVRVLIPSLRASQPGTPPALTNEIDRLVWAKLAKMRLRASDTCDDATYLRR
ncbi:MAG: hypothetical protein ABGZ35_31915, partial [Planctomycetaceae bacterium]